MSSIGVPVDMGDVDARAGGQEARKSSTFSAVRGITSIEQGCPASRQW
jgi:hypothetical protein